MRLLHLALFLALSLAGGIPPARAAAPSVKAVIETYANIAEATYADTLAAAVKLRASIQAFLAKPNAETLDAARKAWRAARIPYMQTEAYRFGNKIVDDWEKKVNAWPLDEGLIDYVAGEYGTDSPENELYAANVAQHHRGRERSHQRRRAAMRVGSGRQRSSGVTGMARLCAVRACQRSIVSRSASATCRPSR